MASLFLKSPRAAMTAGLLVGAMISVLPVAVSEAQTQSASQRGRERGAPDRGAPQRVASRGAGALTAPNECADMMAQPTVLSGAPEGFAVLRLKRELESAVYALEQSQQLEREQLQRFSQMQRGMDSLVQVIVRRNADGTEQHTMTVRLMPDVPTLIRTMQPQVAALALEAESRVLRNSAGGAGYMGITLSGAQMRVVTPEGVMTSHCEYPMVETVDAGSPAARAGIVAGDTVVSYNGRDLKKLAINYPAMLVPGETVRLRVVKSGKAREYNVTVAPRAEEEPVRTMIFMRANAPSAASGAGSPTGNSGSSGRNVAVPPVPVTGFISPAGVAVLAGAQFTTVDDQLAQSLQVEPGVLVLRVPGGTPAADAGLRPGEILRAVNGTAVRDVATLRRVLSTAGAQARLELQSKTSGTRVVVLQLK